MDETAFLVWCRHLHLSAPAQQAIAAIRAAPPSRRVRSGAGNVPVRYPSRKMGRTIQAESHSVELPFVHTLEQDSDVLEYWDQPPPLRLDYRSRQGRRVVTHHTADFFVLRAEGAGWVECKPEQRLQELARQSPHRYLRDEAGQWRCPPGEAVAAPLGLSYRLWSAATINWTEQRNWAFLADYLRAECPPARPQARALVLALVEQEPGIQLAHLRQRSARLATADDLYRLIATGELYVDLRTSALADSDDLPVFRDAAVAQAYAIVSRTPPDGLLGSPALVPVAEGAAIHWEGRPWTIGPLTPTHTTLVSAQGVPVTLRTAVFETYVRDGRITGVAAPPAPGLREEGQALLARASRADQAEANRRYALLRPYLEDGVRLADCAPQVPRSTKFLWAKRWREAQARYGHGYLGLLPRLERRTPPPKVLTPDLLALLQQTLATHYATYRHARKRRAYGAFLAACAEQGYPALSERTFYRLAARYLPTYEETRARAGERAAYPYASPTPDPCPQARHGERPWEVAHLDHTELDLVLVSARTGQPLGRPWLSLLVDAFSRRILALYLSFARPSYVACMMALRLCVQRWGRLPQTLVVDGGPEFHSTYFETLLAWYGVTHKTRPPAEPRYGAVGERLFGTLNTTFTHTLLGHTQLLAHPRQLTRAVRPTTQACWTLGELYPWLCRWAHEVYDTIAHPALGQSPRAAWAWAEARGGARPHLRIPYDQDFLIRTLPTTPKGTARVQPGRGIKIDHVLYWCAAFADPAVERTAVAVRFDPFDRGHAYAYLPTARRWVECRSDYYAALHGRSAREVALIAEELRQQRRAHAAGYTVTAKQLAAFQADLEQHEAVLRQRQLDLELQPVLRTLSEGAGLADATAAAEPPGLSRAEEGTPSRGAAAVSAPGASPAAGLAPPKLLPRLA
jgi:transposase InsO family protein